MKMRELSLALSALLALPASATTVAEKEEILTVKNTTIHLLDRLVKKGLLDREEADMLLKQSQKEAAEDTKKQLAQEKQDVNKKDGLEQTDGKGDSAPVRVTYVPDFVKDEIRKEVRSELKGEVVQEVKNQAKSEKWGIPAALPDWVNRFTLYGDFRGRYDGQFYGSDNLPYSYIDWPAVNKSGGLIQAGQNAFLNTTHDRSRYRIRVRLGLDAQIDDNFKAGIRLATSNDYNPVSINQTLGQYGEQYVVALDRAYLQYDYMDKEITWAKIWAGRFANPMMATDNLYDPNISFEGIATTLRLPIGSKVVKNETLRGAESGPQYRQVFMGYSVPDSLFLTTGVFPLQEIALTSHDKWMWAAQGGMDWMFGKDTRFKAAVAYYDYHNTWAVPDPYGSQINDWTAPQFFTKGNSVARISNDIGELPGNPRLVGLAAKFNVLDAMFIMDYGGFGDNHVMLTGNYTNNIGFDQAEIKARTGEDITPRTQAYQVRLDVGRTAMTKFGDWSTYFAYKYLERDSVMDSFNFADFHQGGTDAKGWVVAATYGVAKNTWFNFQWFAANAIDGPPYNLDILMVDLNARF